MAVCTMCGDVLTFSNARLGLCDECEDRRKARQKAIREMRGI